MKVLVIEDSERLRRSLATGLGRSGFAVDAVDNGQDGLAYVRFGKYDVVILDLMLPQLDGLSLLRRLRTDGNGVHVLILSARDQVSERIAGLHAGADDYMIKPFDFDELVARLRALVRREYRSKDPVQRIGELSLDLGRRFVTCDDKSVSLTRTEFSLLEYLLLRRGRVVPKSELIDHLYTDPDHGSENALEVLVHQVRKKVRGLGQEDFICTQRGHGYRIE